MKKVFLAVALTTLLLCNTNAQNSEIEAAMQETKAEQFLKENSFVREDQISSYVGKGIEVYAKIFTDLTSGQRIAALEFFTQNQAAAGTAMNIAASLASEDGKSKQVVSEEEMAPKPLGYLDMDYVGDLITALEQIVSIANNASKKDVFSISYTAPGGIDVYFSQGIKDMWGIKGDASVIFRKKWYGINEYGVRSVQYTRTKGIKIENIAKLIPIIKDAKMIAEKELNASYTSQMQVVPFKPIQITSTPVAEPTPAPKQVQPVENKPQKNNKPTQTQPTQVVKPIVQKAPAPDNTEYKAQLNKELIEVVQKYNVKGMLKSSICSSYMQCARSLLKSESIVHLQTLEKLTTYVEGLLDDNSTVDKQALEKQLSSQKTAEEILEVFKSYMQ